jgi:hypothetical protein
MGSSSPVMGFVQPQATRLRSAVTKTEPALEGAPGNWAAVVSTFSETLSIRPLKVPPPAKASVCAVAVGAKKRRL